MTEPTKISTETKPPEMRPVAVIDVGATAIRMVIAQIDDKGNIHPLESVQHAVHLGKDTFTKGRIQPTTIEECVKILQGFRALMQDYGVSRAEQIRAIATSSVREADNRDAFLDRIYTATQINLQSLEESEVTRLIYAAVQDVLQQIPDLKTTDALIVEVGGGTTELLLVCNGRVTYSNTYGIGALRMRETLETYRTPAVRVRAILDQDIQRAVDDVRRSVPCQSVPYLVAISGDARFAASQLLTDWATIPFAQIGIRMLTTLAHKMASVPVDELVSKYNLAYQDAETVAPSLLTYAQLTKVFKVKKIIIPKASMRDGLLREMAAVEFWTKEFSAQVIDSALTLVRKCQADEAHARHVADLSAKLFQELQPEHRLEKRFELYLRAAALLHEIGMFINNRSYHKHSLYMIMNSDLFGLTRKDMLLIALIARYHRRAAPRQYHEGYITLDRDSRVTVAKLAAILRVADALDSNDRQRVHNLTFARKRGQFIIATPDVEDLTLERMALKQKGTMFEDVYGMQVVLQEALTSKGATPHG